MKKWTGIVAAGAALFMLAAPLRALGGEEDRRVRSTSNCSMDSTWALTMEPEVGIKFEANIESGVPDQTWHVTLRYNKHQLLVTDETTEEDGGFEIIKVENNAQGTDKFTLYATNVDTGEVCSAMLEALL